MNILPLGHPAWIEIDLAQFKKNIAIIQKQIGRSKLCIPIKANAYGHGLIPIAQAAVEAKADYLGVACLQEGLQLRQAGITLPILVLGAIHEDQIPDLLHYELEFTIASLFKAKLVAKLCKTLEKQCKVHVEMDTGMQRTGVRPHTAIELLNYLENEKCFEIRGIYSHLAMSDEPKNDFNHYQIQQFREFIDQYIRPSRPKILCHLANSGGICYLPESYFDMVRPGILTFGYLPGQHPPIADFNEIRPIFSLKAKIAYFKVVGPDTGLSYGHTYKTKTQTRVVTIPVGYGDGLRRELSNRGSVIIHGKRHPISGTICMDQFMVDIHQEEAYVGDEVILIGKDGKERITLEEMAKCCNTIVYEILCGFNNRLPRHYVNPSSNKDCRTAGR